MLYPLSYGGPGHLVIALNSTVTSGRWESR